MPGISQVSSQKISSEPSTCSSCEVQKVDVKPEVSEVAIDSFKERSSETTKNSLVEKNFVREISEDDLNLEDLLLLLALYHLEKEYSDGCKEVEQSSPQDQILISEEISEEGENACSEISPVSSQKIDSESSNCKEVNTKPETNEIAIESSRPKNICQSFAERYQVDLKDGAWIGFMFHFVGYGSLTAIKKYFEKLEELSSETQISLLTDLKASAEKVMNEKLFKNSEDVHSEILALINEKLEECQNNVSDLSVSSVDEVSVEEINEEDLEITLNKKDDWSLCNVLKKTFVMTCFLTFTVALNAFVATKCHGNYKSF